MNTRPDAALCGGEAGVNGFGPHSHLGCGNADRAVIEDPEALFQTRYDAYRPFGIFYAEETAENMKRDLGDAQPVDLTFRGGERIRLSAGCDLELMFLPGSSKGHLGLLNPRHCALFGGDAIQGTVDLVFK